MKVLSVTSECVPLVKTGGLADVAGALPAALAGHGVEMRTILPGYPAVMAAQGQGPVLREIADLFGGPARILRGMLEGTVLYVLDAPHLYGRDGTPYLGPVSYTHLDVYKRQTIFSAIRSIAATITTR